MKSSKKFCPESDVETDSEEEEQEDRQQQIESYDHAIFVAQVLLHFADDKGNEKEADAAFCPSTRLKEAKLQSMKKINQATIHDYFRKK